MKNLSFAKLLPYLASVIVFYLATLSYFSPELLEGKVLRQTDIVQFEGMSKRSVDYRKELGQETLWNDAMFSGLPDYLIATGVPERGLTIIRSIFRGFLGEHTSASLLFLHMSCFWILLLSFRVNPWLAMVGAVTYAFTSYNIINIDAGHFTKSWAISYASLVVAGMQLVFRKKWLLGLGVFAFGLSVQIAAPHYQITFYLAWVCAAFGISHLVTSIKKQELPTFGKQAALLALGIVLALSTAVSRAWMLQEYTPYSIRGKAVLTPLDNSNQSEEGLSKDYAFSWSQGKMETLTLLVANFYGGGSNENLEKGSPLYNTFERLFGRQQADKLLKAGPIVPRYHGDQPFTVGPQYAGAVLCFLFVLSMLVLPNSMRYWLLASVAITMMFSWGDNLAFFNYFLFDYFPGFNKFRSVSMALSMTMLCMALAAFKGLQQLYEQPPKDWLRPLLIAVGVTAGLSLVMALLAGFGDYTSPNDARFPQMFGIQDQNVADQLIGALRETREAALRADAFSTALLIVLAAGGIFFYFKGKLNAPLGLGIIAVLMIGDLWFVGKRYIHEDKFKAERQAKPFQKTAADAKILDDPDPHYRVFTLGSFDKEAKTSYYHKSIGGYFAAKMVRYRDLIARKIYPEQDVIVRSLQQQQLPDFSNTPVLNMLNAKYIKFADEATGVLNNPEALGNAWFVERASLLNGPDQVMQQLGTVDPGKVALLNGMEFGLQQESFQVDSTAQITLTDYAPRKLVYQSQNMHDGLAVFSEIYYPEGWKASIDGEEVPIVRANYALRALEVPAGEHTITFTFDPDSYVIGSKVSGTASWLVMVVFIGALLLHFVDRARSKDKEA